MESDDLASLVRYIMYTNNLENQGLIYTSSKFHWEGDGKNTSFFLPDREYETPQTSWRPTGITTIQDHLLNAYAQVYPNLRVHDSTYPTPEALASITKVGNVDFDGKMTKDTEGSDLIKTLILDEAPRTLYLQAWGGTTTIARALKSISDEQSSSPSWNTTKSHISSKVVILASGFQDNTYAEQIAPNWPALRVEELSDPSDGNIGGWGGRRKQNSTSPDLWVLVDKEVGSNGSEVENWTTDRWVAAAQNDFAARMQWTLTSEYAGANHAPSIKIAGPQAIKARAGSTVKLSAQVGDPDGDQVTVSWWQYLKEGTYSNKLEINGAADNSVTVGVPADAKSRQTISVIAQATDDGQFQLTRYGRGFIEVL
ncbi:hypothetical protein FJTKL_03585 [Diaporthe vaccinii]|uniref:DUF1593-domain-containing protein n=1 Tax=Diaporthe vaccinii TaxID=105482 RepID=A0ABR4DV67_9PEZI